MQSYPVMDAAPAETTTSLQSMAHSMSTRECCARCGRPLACCLCEALPPKPLELATNVLILQHYKELSKGIGTVQLLRPLLANLAIVQPLSGAEALACDAIPSGAGEVALLLYPTPDAIAIDDPDGLEQLRRLCDGRRVTLVAIDGTWSQASKLHRSCSAAAQLQSLPKICLSNAQPARIYHSLRREPGAAQLSTLESVAAALSLIEGDDALWRVLTRPLLRFVEQQHAFKPQRAAAAGRAAGATAGTTETACGGGGRGPRRAGGSDEQPSADPRSARFGRALAAGDSLLRRATRQLHGWRASGEPPPAAARHVALWMEGEGALGGGSGSRRSAAPAEDAHDTRSMSVHHRRFARTLRTWCAECAALLSEQPAAVEGPPSDEASAADELLQLLRAQRERWSAHAREAQAFLRETSTGGRAVGG